MFLAFFFQLEILTVVSVFPIFSQNSTKYMQPLKNIVEKLVFLEVRIEREKHFSKLDKLIKNNTHRLQK